MGSCLLTCIIWIWERIKTKQANNNKTKQKKIRSYYAASLASNVWSLSPQPFWVPEHMCPVCFSACEPDRSLPLTFKADPVKLWFRAVTLTIPKPRGSLSCPVEPDSGCSIPSSPEKVSQHPEERGKLIMFSLKQKWSEQTLPCTLQDVHKT